MGVKIGIDVGSISVKLAVVGDKEDRSWFSDLAARPFFYLPNGSPEVGKEERPFLVTSYQRIKGSPVAIVEDLLKELFQVIPREKIEGIRLTGSGGKLISELLGVAYENEFKAIAKGMEFLYPDVRTVFEMGGEVSKYLRLEPDESSGSLGIVDYEKSGDCAAGTGSFMDVQAIRLKYKVEDIGEIVLSTEKAAKIAGRCSVFAKSDMIHAQQKGYTPPEILKGLCEAVARNFKGSITKGKKVVPKVAMIGGMAANKGVVAAIEDVFDIPRGELFIPPYYAWIEAIGAAYMEAIATSRANVLEDFGRLREYIEQVEFNFPTQEPLDRKNLILLRERVKPYSFEGKKGKVPAYLGIDIGSVSTNLAVIDEEGEVIKTIYTRTKARPIEVVAEGLKEIERDIGDKIEIKGVGTTGSGRELIGKLIGADTIRDEITAHKTGSFFIGRKLLDLEPDTIFDIGGQDSKYISLDKGIVVDFTMNEACAAGTGSFLEERAEELGINIVGEFAELAFRSKAPIRLGERCTVFMERDVNAYLQKGAKVVDLVAGLAYSVVYNYINRVVRGRKIGKVIFFQGGTAYNDAVAAAFSKVLGQKIIVPPHNGVMGAIGAALLAKEKVEATGEKTKFRGYDLSKVKYELKEFTCHGCTNYCDIQMFVVEGEKTFWGDKCSERYRKEVKLEREPVIPNLIKMREEWLLEDYDPNHGGETVVGIPRAMYTYDWFPFWNAFFSELGFRVLLSDPTNKKIVNEGVEAVVAEPCFPIKVAHGHVKVLLDAGVDFVFVPNLINVETKFTHTQSYVCNWGMTLPFVLSASPRIEPYKDRIFHPTLRFRLGREHIEEVLAREMKRFGIRRKKVKQALDAAYRARERFNEKLIEAGREALRILEEKGEQGIILVGRPYNIYDKEQNLDIPGKLRDYYGVNVIPYDFLDLEDIDIRDVNPNMFWNYGRRILATAKFIKDKPHLHIIYITNFKCGPDSYVKQFVDRASGRPFLALQFDGHSNDAGFITRCEAYLDSKGVLRWWKREERPKAS